MSRGSDSRPQPPRRSCHRARRTLDNACQAELDRTGARRSGRDRGRRAGAL